MIIIVFLLVAIILVAIFAVRFDKTKFVPQYISDLASPLRRKYDRYSYQTIRKKIKDLGQDYTPRQYTIQLVVFGLGAALISYLYFYNVIISIIYVLVAISTIPFLAYLRCKRLYSEFVFEQIQVYTTNTIMEFQTTQSFVKALEGVYESGVLEDPVKSDVKMMIDLAYENGSVEESIKYMNEKYDYYIVKNMHQLFYQITTEGSKNSSDALENMSQDIDMLVEGVYRDRLDRASFHKKFLLFGIVLYLMVMLVQFLLGVDTYIGLLDNMILCLLLHGVLIVNTFFLLRGEKYYNENVGAE